MIHQRLIRAAIAAAGSTREISKALQVSPSAVNAWTMRGRIPSRHVETLCLMGGNVVTPEQIRHALSTAERSLNDRSTTAQRPFNDR